MSESWRVVVGLADWDKQRQTVRGIFDTFHYAFRRRVSKGPFQANTCKLYSNAQRK